MEIVTNNYERFIDLCQQKNDCAILSLLEEGVSVNDADENGISLLHVALSMGTETVLNSLLFKGADVDRCSNTGWTPLMCAARSGQFKIVQQLVNYGAKVSHRNKLGISVLSAAAASGSKEVIKILLNTLQRSSLPQDDIAWSLRIAALHGHSSVLQLLLDSHTHLINASDEHGITSLMLASAGGHEEAVKTLLDFGANSDQKNVQHFTALDIASAKGYKKLECLLKGKTKQNCNHHHDDSLHSKIGSDLVECYGWSSICTPKLRGRMQHENFPNSPSQEALKNYSSSVEQNSLYSKILLKETEDNSDLLSLLFSPVQQSLYNNSSCNTQRLESNLRMEVKSSPLVPTFSPCNYSSHFKFPPFEKHYTPSNLNNNSPYPEHSTCYNLSMNHNFNNKPCESVTNNCVVQTDSESVTQTIHKESNEKIRIGGKVEKWVRSFLALWQKKVKNNKSRHDHHGKLLSQSENFQNSTILHENNCSHQFQRKKDPDTNTRDNLTTSSNFSTLNNLLINLDLKSYVSLFQHHEIDMDSFLMLSEEDLEDIGITSPRCKNKLLKVIKTFKGEN